MVLSLGLAFAYAMHIPFSFPLERIMQREIEEKVRLAAGLRLNELMRPEDTAVLEPLGYIGWAARNKTIYDMPGLGSQVSVDALKERRRPSVATLIDALKPNYAVLRPRELGTLKNDYPETAGYVRAGGAYPGPAEPQTFPISAIATSFPTRTSRS